MNKKNYQRTTTPHFVQFGFLKLSYLFGLTTCIFLLFFFLIFYIIRFRFVLWPLDYSFSLIYLLHIVSTAAAAAGGGGGDFSVLSSRSPFIDTY